MSRPVADFTQARKLVAGDCALTSGDIDHGSCFPPRMPAAGAKRLRGGRKTTVSKVRHRTGVHGFLPFYATDDTRLHWAIFAVCMVSKGLTAGDLGPSFRGDVLASNPKSRPTPTAVIPARAGIQYAAASRLSR